MWVRFNEQIEIKNRDNVTHEQKHFLIMYYMLTERINLEYKMKKKIGFIALFIGLLLGTATAQSKLEFCVEVKEKGECLQPSKSFQVESRRWHYFFSGQKLTGRKLYQTPI
jgi:hypothetical protein